MVKIVWTAPCHECATLVRVDNPDEPQAFYLCPQHTPKDKAA